QERKARVEAERKARELELARQEKETGQKQPTLQGVKFVKGEAGTGQPHVLFPQLHFRTENLFALGSPIGLFLIVRGVEKLGPEYRLPHCRQMFNIFHPFDPVAYRLEPLICDTPPEKPVLMPHHKGRKRFHLELYETVEHVGASMKHYVVEGMRNMWQQLNELARSHRSGDQPLQITGEEPDTPTIVEAEQGVVGEKEVGRLNLGRRVDYVLQEKPIEKLNQYLFALSSHLSYWRSEDTALFILKEVYEEMNPELIKS
ncbi:SEC23-interacting protein, partial [Geodia barretti]